MRVDMETKHKPPKRVIPYWSLATDQELVAALTRMERWLASLPCKGSPRDRSSPDGCEQDLDDGVWRTYRCYFHSNRGDIASRLIDWQLRQELRRRGA